MPQTPARPAHPAAPLLRVDQAQAAIAAALQPLAGVAQAPLDQALGRILAADVVSPIDVPAHDNAAMDGFAFDGQALRPGQALTLRSAGSVMAGRPFGGTLGAGECLRIMTGAALPPGLDTVVPLELCSVDAGNGGSGSGSGSGIGNGNGNSSSGNSSSNGNSNSNNNNGNGSNSASASASVHIPADSVQRGAHCRQRGEDLRAGQPALAAGRVLRPADLGLLASLGLAQVSVRQPLRVALLSTGDEVVQPGQPLPPGAIYDSNRASLAGAVRRLGMQVLDLGSVRDDPAALHAALCQAAAQADVVLTSGGVSSGDADHTRAVLAALGTVAFWQVAMRPGRPFAFGSLRGSGGRTAWLFALPGNPVAALVSFYVLVRAGLLQLAGATAAPLPLLPVRTASPIAKRPGRSEYARGTVGPGPDGQCVLTLAPDQGAGVLRSMSASNALAVLHHDLGPVAAGALVDVWLFDGLA